MDQQQWNNARNEVVEQIKQDGNENLAETIKTTKASNLKDEKRISALKSAFPEHKSKLITIKQKAKQFTEGNHFTPKPEQYFRRNENGTNKFKPELMAQDILKDFPFKYVEDTGQLYVYNENYWKDRGVTKIRNEVNKRLGDDYEPHFAGKTVDTIKDKEEITCKKKDFRPCSYKVPFKNCTYNLKTGEEENHSPENNFTHKISYELDRDASCPEIEEFLETVTEGQRDKELILETMAYSLLADVPYAHALMLHGEGNNGKTVLLNIWKNLISEENYKEEDLQQLEHTRFATRTLYRKLALFSDDMSSAKLETGSTLKSLTGGGETRAEIKGGDHFEFKNFATPVFACNEIPETDDNSDGFFRRWEIINFPYKFVEDPKRDFEKEQKPKEELLDSVTSDEEMRGLVNECLVRLELMKENGGFTTKTDPDDTRSLWKSYSSPLEQFMENCIEQGLTPNDAEDLQPQSNENGNNLNDFSYDYIVYDDLVYLVKKYCQHYGDIPPTKTQITQYLKSDKKTPYYTEVGRTRRVGDENERTKVYKYIKFSDEFLNFVNGKTDVSKCPYFFQNLCAHAMRVSMNLDETPDTRTPGSAKSLTSEIRDFIEEKQKDLIPKQDLIDELDYDEEEVEKRMRDMEHDGEIYEPEPGKIQKI